MPPATWWATFGKHLPFISAVARQVLAQPVCASSARDHNWSLYGKIKTAESSHMGHETANKRVHCHGALQPQGEAAERRLQAGGRRLEHRRVTD